ncbi:MAG: glycogen/starch/alpha-glucan phosphorylase, partial [Oscillospiraceae bacterium]|nr:glycogen/starch/alpha-glucan phosphorylase [Oscillospiraceae bacterium]
ASELSEQISTAGKEASGTGNMKFMMNGALTIGTMDGANVEMHEQVGDDNIFIFGLSTQEVNELKSRGYYAYDYYMNSPDLKWIMKFLNDGFADGQNYSDLTRRLISGDGCPADEYMLLADFESYKAAHSRVDETYREPKKWNRMSLINIARSGIFSADRSIRDYADTIWNVPYRE